MLECKEEKEEKWMTSVTLANASFAPGASLCLSGCVARDSFRLDLRSSSASKELESSMTS